MRKLILSFDVASGYNAHYKRVRVLPIGHELVQDLIKTEPNVIYLPSEYGKWIVGKLHRSKLFAMFSFEENKPFDMMFVDANSYLSLVIKDGDSGEKLYENELHQGGFAINKTKETEILSDVIRDFNTKTQGDSFLLMGESKIVDGTITFRINIDGDFDINKLTFLTISANNLNGVSGVLSDMLSKNTCCMNAVMYDDMIYTVNQEDINILYVYRNTGMEYFDLVNSKLESLAPERYQKTNKY